MDKVIHFGKPVAKIVPYNENPDQELLFFRDSVISYDDPTEPVGEADWEVLK